jgi:hypothetical protein
MTTTTSPNVQPNISPQCPLLSNTKASKGSMTAERGGKKFGRTRPIPDGQAVSEILYKADVSA